MTMYRTRIACVLSLGLAAAGGSVVWAADATDSLWTSFQKPPVTAAPRVWWHWMNGNVTTPGLTADLQWLHQVGIGGVQVFEGDLNTPVVVPERLVYMSAPWKSAFSAAAERSRQLGMEFSIATSPGWSATGGPWVRPQDAMKKLVWSEQVIAGGAHFHGVLPRPPEVAGPYQDVLIGAAGTTAAGEPRLYVDSKLIAYPSVLPRQGRLPAADSVRASSGAPIDERLLTDGRFAAGSSIAADPAQHSAWIQYCYRSSQIVRAVIAGVPGRTGFGAPPPPLASLQASDDGMHFHTAAELAPSGLPVRETSFAPVSGRCFRLLLRADTRPTFVELRGHAPGALVLPSPTPPSSYAVSEFELYTAARVKAAADKAGFATAADYYALATPAAPMVDVVPVSRVIDLTGRLQPDGTLDWTAPKGSDWVVLRLGYSLTGRRNGPAPPEATGLEVDKLDPGRVDHYLQTYLGLYDAALGHSQGQQQAQKLLDGLLSDSIEAGPQNWTDDLLDAFQRLRGYDPRPWLPALTGVIVGSSEQSDRFLWDFRRTIAQRISTYYAHIAQAAHARGLRYYSEALEDHRPQLGDDMEMRSHSDVPMGAMWTFPDGGQPAPTYLADLKGAASVAHVYDRTFVGAESMTAYGWPWGFAPRDLKPVADLEFALGVNLLSIHESTEQPFTDDHQPGLSLNPTLGQYFNRNETWAGQALGWVRYLTRSSYLLQQGTYQADVAYFYGEGAPLTSLFGDHPERAVPPGYGFDYVGADALLHVLKLQDHMLVAPSGTRYPVVYLGGSSRYMTLPVLEQLARWVYAGLTVVGEKPLGSPSLADDPRAIQRITDALWGPDTSADDESQSARRRVGEGWVYGGQDLAAALRDRGVAPDWQWSTAASSAAVSLRVLHRRLADGDMYFVVNPSAEAIEGELSVRVSGRRPQLWYADSGRRVPASYEVVEGRTVVPLQLSGHEAVFLMLREPTNLASWTAPQTVSRVLQTLTGPWNVTFQANRGAPPSATLDQLQSWTDSNQQGIRYFSGIARYQKDFQLPPGVREGTDRLWLDLGDVRDVVTVTVNGQLVGTLWHPPYRVDITPYLKPGADPQQLTLDVTNLWVNRLIGDAQPGAQHYTFVTGPTYQANAPLRPSGLLGPVQVIDTSGQP